MEWNFKSMVKYFEVREESGWVKLIKKSNGHCQSAGYERQVDAVEIKSLQLCSLEKIGKKVLSPSLKLGVSK
jgi:hypothetical protein